MEALEERQTSTREALVTIEKQMREKIDAEKEREQTGLDTNTFTIYWLLKQEGLRDPVELAKEIDGAYKRFPNYRKNSDELRQLKAEMYKSLLRVADGKRMVDLSEQVLRLERI
jgi:hypothetical protein